MQRFTFAIFLAFLTLNPASTSQKGVNSETEEVGTSRDIATIEINGHRFTSIYQILKHIFKPLLGDGAGWTRPTTTTTSATTTSTTTTTTTTTTTEAPPYMDPCHVHISECGCGMAQGCSYASSEKKCYSTDRYCHEMGDLLTGCLRRGSFYIIGGVICPIPSHILPGSCFIEERVNAINLGGSQSHMDSHGILHSADTTRYPSKYRRGTTDAALSNPDDVEIYSSFITKTTKGVNATCRSYFTHIFEDGEYELIVKVVEHEYENEADRVFHIDFPSEWDVHPLAFIDPIRYFGFRNRGGEFILKFEIFESQTMIRMLGYPDRTLERKGRLRLKICGGLCGRLKDSLVASGFSVVRLASQGDLNGSYIHK